MTWTTPNDLRAQVQRLWNRGLLLAGLIDGTTFFPRRLILKGPSSSALPEQFEQARTWIADIRKLTHCRVVMREWRHPVLGANKIPDEVWIDSLEEALTLIGKNREARHFAALVALTRERQAAAMPWLARHPLRALDLADDWQRLMDVVAWMQAHPRPGIYLRQIDVPGVHTKFIEAHRTVLTELLDLALPPGQIDTDAVGAAQFCRRYGFRDRPLRIRFRVLDPLITLLPGGADRDIALNHDAFAGIKTEISQVFITENEINFLAFPDLPGSMVIFGAGYGFEMLAQAAWLHSCAVHYWGDIDTHGFAILDQLRAHLPHAESFLMDRETLMAHQPHWVDEAQPVRRDLPRLNDQERELFDDLRNNRLREGVRLEQERIEYGWVKAALKVLVRG